MMRKDNNAFVILFGVLVLGSFLTLANFIVYDIAMAEDLSTDIVTEQQDMEGETEEGISLNPIEWLADAI